MVDFEGEASESDETQVTSEPEQESQPESAPEAAPEKEAAPVDVPFHEHPRFKELVEQKNQYSDEIRDLKYRLEQFERRQSQNPEAKPSDPLVEKLRGIDPDLANRIEKYGQTEQTIAQLTHRLEQAESARTQAAAQSELKRLYTESKVSTEAQPFYEASLMKMASANPKLGLQDLPKVFKEVHDSFTKVTENMRRADRQSYVTEKKVDAKAPTSQPKGTPAKPAKEKLPMDKEQMLAQLAKGSVKKFRASVDL